MRLAIRDLTFEVRVDGPAGAPAILLLHGFPQHGGMWQQVSPVLHAAGYQTIAPDQRGYSPGARPSNVESYAIPEVVADALAMLDALDLPAVHLVGHDWGAIVGWHLAYRHPERVRTFTALSVPHPHAIDDALRTDTDQAERFDYWRLFRIPGKAEEVLLRDDAVRLRAMFEGCPQDLVDGYLGRMLEPDALTAALNWYRAWSPGERREVGPVSVPTTFVWGDRDLAIGPTAARRCGAYVIEQYSFVPLIGISHWIADQAPADISAIIVDQIGKA